MGFGASMQPIANSLLRSFGGGRTGTLRQYDEAPDPISGKTARYVCQAIPDLLFVVEEINAGTFEGQRRGDLKLILSGSQAGARPPIDGSWTFQIDGEETQYSLVLPITGINPDGDAVIWEAVIRKGATVGGTL